MSDPAPPAVAATPEPNSLTLRTEPEPALAVRDLWKRYRQSRSWALAHVSIEVGSGRFLALVGPNGAGKSTLLRTWLGFEHATRGDVRVGGFDPWQDRERAIPILGYIPQNPSLYDELSVEEHIDLAGYLRKGFDKVRALERVDSLGLPRRARADELSGGQRAQLALALVLAAGAKTLLLDEPLASLDPLARREFLRVLATAARASGATVVVSSHLVTDIADDAQDLVVLVAGRVHLAGEIGQLKARHAVIAPHRARPQHLAGVFPDGAGELALIRLAGPAPAESRPPSLEELVLGYLAAPEASEAGVGLVA